MSKNSNALQKKFECAERGSPEGSWNQPLARGWWRCLTTAAVVVVAFNSSGRWGCSMSAATFHGGGDE